MRKKLVDVILSINYFTIIYKKLSENLIVIIKYIYIYIYMTIYINDYFLYI
jgi:hypothetical protein